MFYKAYTITGVINVATYDAGLQSPVDNPVHLNAVIINSSATEGNIIEGWIGNKRVLEAYDYCFDTQEECTAQAAISATKIGRLPIDLDIPPGKSFRIAIRCGGTASNLFGSYEYTEGAA